MIVTEDLHDWRGVTTLHDGRPFHGDCSICGWPKPEHPRRLHPVTEGEQMTDAVAVALCRARDLPDTDGHHPERPTCAYSRWLAEVAITALRDAGYLP